MRRFTETSSACSLSAPGRDDSPRPVSPTGRHRGAYSLAMRAGARYRYGATHRTPGGWRSPPARSQPVYTVRAGHSPHRCIGSCRTTSSTCAAAMRTSSRCATAGGGAWWRLWSDASSSGACWRRASRECAAAPVGPRSSWRSAARPGTSGRYVTRSAWGCGSNWTEISTRPGEGGRGAAPRARQECDMGRAQQRHADGSPGPVPRAESTEVNPPA